MSEKLYNTVLIGIMFLWIFFIVGFICLFPSELADYSFSIKLEWLGWIFETINQYIY